MTRLQKILLTLFIVPAIFYVCCASLIWWAMHQSPETFGKVMARMPQPAVFMLFPFETLWLHARAGELSLGSSAPDFLLMKVDKSGSVRLSDLNRERPVVLVFGSYT
jgi:hypothetical protein